MARLDYPEPSLTDGTVVLRRPRREDVPRIVAACQDPQIARFCTEVPQPYAEHHARLWLGTIDEGVRTGTGLPFAIADAASGELIGATGLDAVDARNRRADTGYWIAPGARGRGVAAAAVRLVTDWALGPLGLVRMQMYVDVENEVSLRVAERAGYVREGVLRSFVEHRGARHDMVLLARLAQ